VKPVLSRHAWDVHGLAKVLSQIDDRDVRSRTWTGPKTVRSNMIVKIRTFTLGIATTYFLAIVTATALRHNTENVSKHAGQFTQQGK